MEINEIQLGLIITFNTAVCVLLPRILSNLSKNPS
jgi:hypothetical protein